MSDGQALQYLLPVTVVAVASCASWYFCAAGRSKSSRASASAPSPAAMSALAAAAAPERAPLREFTCAELAAYTGAGGSRIYIGMDGYVFDMSSHEGGPAFYGPGGGYAVFAGRDATVGLSSMELDPAKWTRTSVAQLSASERDTAADWVGRFRGKYAVVGVLTDGAHPRSLAELRQTLAS